MQRLVETLRRVKLPPVIRVRQPVDGSDSLEDAGKSALDALDRSGLAGTITPGMTVAVGVGSRGIDQIASIVRATLDWMRVRGARPFIVPAMGSHGGGSAHSQKSLLAELGISEESMGCPIQSDMDAVHLGEVLPGLHACLDKNAAAADGIFIINRIKPHNAFRGENESGVVKMLVVGLGKQAGAASCHDLGFAALSGRIQAVARYTLDRAKILGGMGIVENAIHKPCIIEAFPASRMLERDAALLKAAKEKMVLLPLDYPDGKAHVLIVDEMGKNISGSGMDPNVTGRFTVDFLPAGPHINKIAVLDLTPHSEGNAVGMGIADFITWRLRDKIDFPAMYTNSITSTLMVGSRMPCALPSDRDAIRAAVRTCNEGSLEKIRFIHIKNTLELETLEVSASMAAEMRARGCEILSEPYDLRFDGQGGLISGII